MSTSTAPTIAPVRVNGDLCWHELHTRDRARATEFYTKLIGWTVSGTIADGYNEWIIAGGEHVGGMMDMPPGVPTQVPASWAVYVNVEDVDACARRAVELGGRMLAPPMDIPNVGRLCPIADPTGACLHLFKGVGDCGCKKPEMGTGTFCWNELLTHDPDTSERFHRELFQWTTSRMPLPGGDYTIFWVPGAVPEKKEGWVGGMMKIAAEWGPMPSCWLSYINVESVDATAARIPGLGGTVFCPPTDIPNVGRFAVAQDPTGAMFALFMSKPHEQG